MPITSAEHPGRRPTRVVHVGDVAVGGEYPIRIQSMTTTVTSDVEATSAQIARLAEAGCEIVRVTVPTTSDADALPAIRKRMAERGIRVPLVADIHFTPQAALRAVEHVEKIRINPGNFADRKRFAVREYTDAEYSAELERIECVFAPLVGRCRELGVAMRIGTNHGSLSDRILNRYGDTPEGMVESALEFVRICEAHGYRELILSMKASSPAVVLRAYRLLADRMSSGRMDYPFHLGVTEAGDGEDGRIKSAIGIGALLEDGLGDTVRVSLTEDPVAEIPVARALVAPYGGRGARPRERGSPYVLASDRRVTAEVAIGDLRIGGTNPVAVEVMLRSSPADPDALQQEIEAHAGSGLLREQRADVLVVTAQSLEDIESLARLRRALRTRLHAALSLRVPLALALPAELLGAADRLEFAISAPLDGAGRRKLSATIEAVSGSGTAVLVEVGAVSGVVQEALSLARTVVERARASGSVRLLLAIDPLLAPSPLHSIRSLDDVADGVPIVLVDRPEARGRDPLLAPSAVLGGVLCDGIGDAVRVESGGASDARALAFGILQASRRRITRAEFISCPSCGRTLFDLEDTTARIKARTAHLKDVKIAIMGCVVNGPGEMADADFGYVGWGERRVALFVGRTMVEKDIPVDQADERLVELIKSHGRWTDPPAQH